MICYKCDICGDLHYSLGEMNNVKISYAGKANVTLPCNGEFIICGKCETYLLNVLMQTKHKVEEELLNSEGE